MVFKPKPKKYVSDSFEFDLDKTLSNLEENKFVKRNTNSGYSYTKIIDKTAFKVTFIISAEKYLEQSEQGKGSSIKGLNQCDKFIGFEVFLDSNEKRFYRMFVIFLLMVKIYTMKHSILMLKVVF